MKRCFIHSLLGAISILLSVYESHSFAADQVASLRPVDLRGTQGAPTSWRGCGAVSAAVSPGAAESVGRPIVYPARRCRRSPRIDRAARRARGGSDPGGTRFAVRAAVDLRGRNRTPPLCGGELHAVGSRAPRRAVLP